MKRRESCPVCGSSKAEDVARLDAARRARFLELSARKYGGLMDGWIEGIDLSVRHCGACGHFWISHQPDAAALGAMYGAGHPLDPTAKPLREPSPMIRAEMARLYGLARDLGHRQPTFLDYGSGFGRWARAAQEAGFEVTAFEPSAPRAFEERGVGFELVHDLAALEGRRFDCINIEQVLEHLPDPLAVLRDVRRFCAAGGFLRVTVPNMRRTTEGGRLWEDWPFDGRRIHSLSPFEHLQGFTPDSLLALLKGAGYVPLSGPRVWRRFPLRQIRRLVGLLAPKMGQTFLLARPA